MERALAETVIVPGLFWHEVRSVLVVAERKERIEADAAECHIERLRTLRFVTDNDQDDRRTSLWPAGTASAATTRLTWRQRRVAARNSPRSTRSSQQRLLRRASPSTVTDCDEGSCMSRGLNRPYRYCSAPSSSIHSHAACATTPSGKILGRLSRSSVSSRLPASANCSPAASSARSSRSTTAASERSAHT